MLSRVKLALLKLLEITCIGMSRFVSMPPKAFDFYSKRTHARKIAYLLR